MVAAEGRAGSFVPFVVQKKESTDARHCERSAAISHHEGEIASPACAAARFVALLAMTFLRKSAWTPAFAGASVSADDLLGLMIDDLRLSIEAGLPAFLRTTTCSNLVFLRKFSREDDIKPGSTNDYVSRKDAEIAKS